MAVGNLLKYIIFFAEWLYILMVDDCRLLCVWDGGWVPSVQLRPPQGEGATGLHGRRPWPRGDALPLQLPGPCRRRRTSQVSTQQRLATTQLPPILLISGVFTFSNHYMFKPRTSYTDKNFILIF